MPYRSTLAEPSTKKARSMAVWHAVEKQTKKQSNIEIDTSLANAKSNLCPQQQVVPFGLQDTKVQDPTNLILKVYLLIGAVGFKVAEGNKIELVRVIIATTRKTHFFMEDQSKK